MVTTPVAICNLALQEAQTRSLIAGFPPIDNSPAAVSANLFFTPKTTMLLRAANWDFARRQAQLSLLKQAYLNGVPTSNPPPQPFLYSYAYPSDCLRARFIMQFQTTSTSTIPFTTGQQYAVPAAYATTSVPFVVANDPQSNGAPQKVILTNMQNAMLVYTCDLSQNPDMWDSMFLAAETAVLASYFIASLSGDKALMQLQISAAKGVLDSARGMNGNEGITSMDRVPDWITARLAGGLSSGWTYGSGIALPSMGGWDQCQFPNGLSY